MRVSCVDLGCSQASLLKLSQWIRGIPDAIQLCRPCRMFLRTQHLWLFQKCTYQVPHDQFVNLRSCHYRTSSI